ncbi:MAG: GrpB family protein, partial [Bacilli bacterium]
YHLHVRYPGDWDELYFRDYLIDHPEVAKQYSLLKQELSQRYRTDREAYTEAKTLFIREYTLIARREYGNRYTT